MKQIMNFSNGSEFYFKWRANFAFIGDFIGKTIQMSAWNADGHMINLAV